MTSLDRLGSCAAIAMLVVACQHKPAPGEEISSACRVENDKKEISVSGYLQSPILVGCDSGKACSFQLTPKRDQKYDLRIDIPLGSGPGTMTPLAPPRQSMSGSTFIEPVTVDIRDSTGASVGMHDVLRVTGTMHAYANSDGTMQCELEVKKFARL